MALGSDKTWGQTNIPAASNDKTWGAVYKNALRGTKQPPQAERKVEGVSS